MGGALKSIGGAIGGIIKTVAPAILKAIAPAATGILKGIVGDAFQAGGSFLNKLAGNLPGPLAGLAQKLLGAALPKLQQLAEGGLEKGLTKLMDMVTQRFLPGLGNIAPPSITDPSRQAAIVANSPSAASSSAAATASTSNAATAPSAGGVTSGSVAPSATTSGAPTSPPDPKNYGDLQDQNNMQKLLKDQQAYQTNFSAMQNYWSMISNIMKANFDTLKGMSQNLR